MTSTDHIDTFRFPFVFFFGILLTLYETLQNCYGLCWFNKRYYKYFLLVYESEYVDFISNYLSLKIDIIKSRS